ncbi:nuclear transport factor 2 family protein [Ktedonospora formicarum]|uniref:SnoaL-like domain-containing protein n=1 Tax=Ktedonospora formicarum TaxID=2778364 RepID=A0A8J3I7C1_9CHLR|nr:nuclear transport factor 2 family protein [Ktedonospora formicarum]GHO47392.1 hypothetical protein KSX_55550 [Ktedonospora formicarum]
MNFTTRCSPSTPIASIQVPSGLLQRLPKQQKERNHDENGRCPPPADALTAWQNAFFTRDANAFAEEFAENVVLEASALREPVVGRERVRQLLWTTAEIYESLVFTDQARSGQRCYVEWVATAFGGKPLRGSTILATNQEGKIDHVVIQHRPLDGLLAFSAELGKRMIGAEDAGLFWKDSAG